METFTEAVTCIGCNQPGTGTYRRVSATASTLIALDCPGGCWKGDGPGVALIKMLNDAPAVER